MAVRIEYVTTKLPAPNMRGFFRPTVSRARVIKLCGIKHTSNMLEVGKGTYKKFVIGPTAPYMP